MSPMPKLFGKKTEESELEEMLAAEEQSQPAAEEESQPLAEEVAPERETEDASPPAAEAETSPTSDADQLLNSLTEPEAASGQETANDEPATPADEGGKGGDQGDDLLGAFQAAATVSSETSDLANQVEDIPIQELLGEVRAVADALAGRSTGEEPASPSPEAADDERMVA